MAIHSKDIKLQHSFVFSPADVLRCACYGAVPCPCQWEKLEATLQEVSHLGNFWMRQRGDSSTQVPREESLRR
eukprot:4877539-Amphidinium_carterae.1